ncbi:MAG: acetate--CoA ligase family protein [Xanthobacteraceae bacterium]|nr:acetate--CoA ligase family protein [Xanthobacteraceae bacterium]
MANALDRLFSPRSVAVLGASADPSKLTGRPVDYLKRHGFTGAIYPVNPRYQELAGLPCYPAVSALPTPPDVGLVLLGADRVVEAVRDLARAGTPAAIVLASGFGEAGAEGQQRQHELKQAAGRMRLLGPNTIGLVNVTDRIMLSASGAMELAEFPTGSIALVSQSGGILGSLLSRGAARGIGFSKLIATGNEADLEVSDCLDYLLDDPETAVIALYLEGLRAPDRFRAAAARAAQIGKPIVAFKVGRSEAGMRSAVSHTGALAGADAVYDALFRQLGVIRAASFADLLDIPAALAPRRALRGRSIAIVTSTGGAATLVADSAGLAGFAVPAPDAATAQALNALNLADAVLDRNPIDVTLAGLRPDVLRTVINTLLESSTYDALIVIVGASGIGQPDLVARPVIEAAQATNKPVMVYVSPEAPRIVRHLNRNGVPAFAAPESCAAALAALLKVYEREHVPSLASPQPKAGGSLPAGCPTSGPLNEAESKQLFARFSIPSIQEFVAASAAEAETAAQNLGDRVVLKVLSRHIAHKTEVGGVRVGVPTHDIARHCAEMAAAVSAKSPHGIEGFLVQELIRDGVELILGFHRDPQLGGAVLLGMGGIATELFNDTTLRLVPVTADDAQDMIASLRSAPLLRGFRGRPRYDVDALARAIVAFSDMVVRLGPRLAEAEINPLFVLPEGRGVHAGDGLVILQDL